LPRRQPLLIFSHANSFPASTYRVLFDELRRRGFQVEALEMFGHDPRYPVTSNRPHLVEQLLDFSTPLVQSAGVPALWVGHSLGVLLSLMAAAKAPQMARGVLLLDAPVVGGWQAQMVRVVKKISFAGRFTPGATSARRRFHWPDLPAVLHHFQAKRKFAAWDPQVLVDYVEQGTVALNEAGGSQRVLKFAREIETQIYNTIPDHLPRYLQGRALQCPVALIAGRQSREMRLADLSFTDRVIKGRKMFIDGTHLFPMERPLVTAATIEAALLNLLSLGDSRPVSATDV